MRGREYERVELPGRIDEVRSYVLQALGGTVSGREDSVLVVLAALLWNKIGVVVMSRRTIMQS